MDTDTAPRNEIRSFEVKELRADDENNSITGYAAVFNQQIEYSWFKEVIRAGAFARTIIEDTVFAAWNHNLDTVFASNKAGTIVLREDPVGLHFEIKPPAAELTSLRARYDEMRDMVRGGLIDKMSFGFNVTRQTWSEIDAKTDLREIIEVKLWEISLVPFPAYEGTSVSARSIEAIAEERRASKALEQQQHDQNKFDETEANALAVRAKSLGLKLKLAAR